MIYAVQVRSMHTAIHNLLLFKTKKQSSESARHYQEHRRMPRSLHT
jgi:hypothetical protein